MAPAEAFLSHSSDDHEFTSRLAGILRRHGIQVWYSETNILGAQQWHDEIGNALRRCDWFILVLSPRSIESMWVKRELVFALQQPAYADRIVPLVLEPCDVERLSWVLSSLQMVDFQVGFDEGCRALLRIWGIAYQADVASQAHE
jgi:hypothetical protein